MPTFVMGGQTIEGNFTLEAAIEMLQHLIAQQEACAAVRTLWDVNHLHIFSKYTRECACGMYEVEYMAIPRDTIDGVDICPRAKAQAVQTPKEFFNQLFRKWRKGGTNGKFIGDDDHHVYKLAVRANTAYLHGDGDSNSIDNAVKAYEYRNTFAE